MKDLKKIFKIAVLVLADIIAVNFAYLFALFLRIDSLPAYSSRFFDNFCCYENVPYNMALCRT